jgi:hypothetical protein
VTPQVTTTARFAQWNQLVPPQSNNGQPVGLMANSGGRASTVPVLRHVKKFPSCSHFCPRTSPVSPKAANSRCNSLTIARGIAGTYLETAAHKVSQPEEKTKKRGTAVNLKSNGKSDSAYLWCKDPYRVRYICLW